MKRERNWVRLGEDAGLRRNLEIRSRALAGIRSFFDRQDFLEIDPPVLVPLPGMEPHLTPVGATLADHRGRERRFYLHTSPEYALKKLLSAGVNRLYALVHVFRNGEISATHNPEFMLLEWYRARETYEAIMTDCEALVGHLLEVLGLPERIVYQGQPLDLSPPWPRLTVASTMREHANVDLEAVHGLKDLVAVAHGKGYDEVSLAWPWEDVFYRIFLQEVEPKLPKGRPFFLVDYPVEMAALARPQPGTSRWVERFELYAGGLELANAFSELTDPQEQRRRLVHERQQRARMGQETYPVDVSFLEALERGMPEAAGIALGVDRMLMLLADAPEIRDVLLFPAEDLMEEWDQAHSTES